METRALLTAFSLGSPGFDSADSVQLDSAGNQYVCGSFSGTVDFDPGPGTHNLTNAGSATTPDAFVAKYSPTGQLLWAGQIVDAGSTNGFKLGLTLGSDGDVYLTGHYSGTTDFDLGSGVSTLSAGASGAAFVAKYTADGGLTWARSLGGGTASPVGNAIAVDAAGNVYSAGVMGQGDADMDPGSGTFTLTNTNLGGNAATYISKLDASGNFVWAKMFSLDPNAAAGVWSEDMGVDASGRVYISGLFVNSVNFDTSGGTHWVTAADGAARYGDGYVARLTATGNLDYVVTMGSTGGRDDGYGIAVDPAGNAYVTGQFSTITGQPATPLTITPATGNGATLPLAGGEDLFVMKLNTIGGLDWARSIGGSGFDGGQAIALGTDGLYLTGYFQGTVDFDPNAGVHNVTGAGGSNDDFILKLNTDSTFVNVWTFGGNDYEYSNDIAVNNQGDVGVVGRFQGSGDFDPGPGVVTLTSVGSNDAFVSFLSQGVANRAPVASNGTLTTNEDTPATGTLQASDPDGNALTYSLVDTSGAHGTVKITNATTGAYLYTPDANYNGSASFTFQASDGSLTSNTATVTITVNAVNDAPTAKDASFTVNEDAILQGQVSATDVDGDALTYSVASANRPAHAAIFVMRADGTFTYLPSSNYNGTDQFTYTVSDGKGGTATATVTITVNPVNDPPRAQNQAVTIDEDTPFNGQLSAPDAEGDPVTFTLATAPSHGNAVVNTNGTFTYTPSANFNGTDTFTFRATDDKQAFTEGTVTITVRPVNDAPVSQDDQYSIDEDTSLVLTATPVSRLTMVSAPGDYVGQGLTYDYTPATANFSAQQNFDNGVSINVDPSALGEFWSLDFAAPLKATLTPGSYPNAMRFPFQNTDQPGLDVSGNGRGLNQLVGAFTVRDVAYGSGTAVDSFAATFVQQELNFDGSVKPPLTGTIQYNTTLGAGGGVLANDSDVDGDLLTAHVVTGPSHGSLTLNRDGTLTYTPDANFNGTDTFTYKANDGTTDGNLATVTITVNPVNDPPTAGTIPPVNVNEDDPPTTLDLKPYFADVEDTSAGLTYKVTANTNPALFSNLSSTNGVLNLTYAPNANGQAVLTITATDSAGASVSTNLQVNVAPVNDLPVVTGQSLHTNEDTPLSGKVVATDVEGDPLTYRLVSGPMHGTLSFNPDGTFTYTPSANYNGSDSFTFVANDGQGDSNVATVAITVEPETQQVAIDIQPGDPNKQINPKSHGKIEVAILSSADFNALSIDVSSLRFGATGQEDSLSRVKGSPRFRFQDVNHDGQLDLVVMFETDQTGFQPGDTQGVLTGSLQDGTTFTGTDTVNVKSDKH